MSERERRRPTVAAGRLPPRRADDDGESLTGAVLEVLAAASAAIGRRIPVAAANRVIAACTLVALVCPLLLWISWSRTGFLIVIGTALVAIAIIYVLIRLHPDDPF